MRLDPVASKDLVRIATCHLAPGPNLKESSALQCQSKKGLEENEEFHTDHWTVIVLF